MRKTDLSRRRFILKAGALSTALPLAPNPLASAASGDAPQDDPHRIMVGYVWGFGDLGGIAIAPGLLNLLYEHFPEYQMTTIGGTLEARTYIQDKFPDCEVLDDDLFRGQAYEAALERAKEDFGGALPDLNIETIDYVLETVSQYVIEEMEQSNPGFIQALRESKLLIYPSGMMLNYGELTLSGMDFWYDTMSFSLLLLVARKLGIPYGIYAQSFMAFEGPPIVHFIKTLMEDAAFVTCRDSSSVEYLKGMGSNGPFCHSLPYHALSAHEGETIDAPHLQFIPDSTVSFGYRDDEWGEAFLAEKNLTSKEFLVVLPRTWPRPSTLTQFIGKERSKRHEHRLRVIIEDWVERTGMKVLIGVEVEEQMPHHRTLIYDPLPDAVKAQCEVQDEWWLSEQATSVFRHARVLAIMDFHSFYLAIPEGTPTVALMTRESGRKIWSCQDFGLPEYMYDIDVTPAATISDRLMHIHEHYDTESARIENEVIPRIRALEAKQMAIIGDVLEAS